MPGGVEPSNLGKVFWPDSGLTKGDLLDYLDAVSPYLVPALRGRPLTVKRYPDGIEAPSFFQKDTPSYAPGWVRTVKLRAESARRDVRYTVCTSKRTLMWLGNQAAIELHPWLARTDRLDRPDHLVLDLDPPEGGFLSAVEVAFLARDVLKELGLDSAVKTSGAKGLHLDVPLVRRHSWAEVRAAARNVADRVEASSPEATTTDIRKANRGGRLFLDTGRNAPGAHVVAPYSPRARPGGPVSFPVPWEDLRSIEPGRFTVVTVPSILASEGDLWKLLLPPPQTLPRSLRES